MRTYQFKTNINCGGCIAKVKPFFDAEPAISHWEVDTQHADKILTVKSASLDGDAVRALVVRAGFSAEPKKRGLLGRLRG